MTWNTGARIIANGLDHPIRIVDMENDGRFIIVPARAARMWDGTIYPWCNSNDEVSRKSFKVTNMDTNQTDYYLFQQYNADVLCYYKHPAANNLLFLPAYDERLAVSDSAPGGGQLGPVSNADIFIMKTHVWGMNASNDVGGAHYLLDRALAGK